MRRNAVIVAQLQEFLSWGPCTVADVLLDAERTGHTEDQALDALDLLGAVVTKDGVTIPCPR